jgi:hypothetical protein
MKRFAARSGVEHGRAIADLAKPGDLAVAEREDLHPADLIVPARLAEAAALVRHDHHEVALGDDRLNLGLRVFDLG